MATPAGDGGTSVWLPLRNRDARIACPSGDVQALCSPDREEKMISTAGDGTGCVCSRRSPQPRCRRRALWHPICQVPIIAVVSIRVVCRMSWYPRVRTADGDRWPRISMAPCLPLLSVLVPSKTSAMVSE